MYRLIFFLILLTTSCLESHAQYVGRVFFDHNDNEIFDKGDRPLKDISVSDGLHVVKTDKDGLFSLAGHPKERFIFITTPWGYKSNNRHYLPIAIDINSYDFGLQKTINSGNEDDSHNFIHLTDTEISSAENHEEWVKNIKEYSEVQKTAFIIHTGDICYENGLKSHIEMMNTENMNCPMFYCIGNHDLVEGKYGEELFESLYGPVYYSFDVGNIHYIVTPMLDGDYKPSYTKEDVYRWLKNDLALMGDNQQIVIFNHNLLTAGDEFVYQISDNERINLNEYNLKAWIYGHWHINYMKKQGEVLTISTSPVDKGGIDHSTSAFRVMHVNKYNELKSELRYPYVDSTIKIASLANGEMPTLLSGAVPLSVNVYSSSSPVKRVEYSYSANEKQLGKKRQLRQQTDWNWYAEIPLGIKNNQQKIAIHVEAKLNNGQTVYAEGQFIYSRTQQFPIVFNAGWSNMLGNPQHIGIAKDTLSPPLSLSWISNVGGNVYMSSPLIYKNNIIIATVDENLTNQAAIYSLDAQTGKKNWKYQLRNSVKNSIATDQGYIFAQDAEGYLYAIDALSGQLAWEQKLATNHLPALTEGLTASNGVIYAGTGKGLAAYECKSGTKLWVNSEWTQGEGATTTPTVGDNVVVTGSQWGALHGNDLTTGKLLWSISEYGLNHRGASSAIHNGLLYIISQNSIFVIEAGSGKIIVRKDLGINIDVSSTPLVTDNKIIFGSVHSGLIALDRETLEQTWSVPMGRTKLRSVPYIRHSIASIETSPILSGQTVWVGASDGTIYGVNKNTGELVWTHNTGAPIFASFATSGNTLIVTDFAGNVYAFVSK